MELDSQTISGYNSGELLQTINSDTIMYKDLFCHIYPNILDAIFVLCISTALSDASFCHRAAKIQEKGTRELPYNTPQQQRNEPYRPGEH